MAETIVNLVLEKVADPLVEEVAHLWGVEEQIEKVRRELDWIRAFLKDADKKQIQEERQKQWVREVREVAYWIEDVIDTFLCEIPPKKPGNTEAVKRLFGKTKKLGDEMNQILERLKEISENKERFGINSLGEGSGGVRTLPVRPPVLPDIEDLDVVGFDADRDNIVNQLLDETNPSLCVVSIVGPGGLGMTTLAKKVYNSYQVMGAYNIRIWVTISQQYKLIDVLKKILEKLGRINESEQGKDEEYFLTKLNKSLQKEKYLLIIDDVWTSDLWTVIGKTLPNDKNGSRILMTTRKKNVAINADPKQIPYELNFLTEESSRELLLKKALPNLEIQNELLDLAQQFVKKCGGLPLALIVLGSLLAQKGPTYSVWNKMMQTMSWSADEQKNCMEIISTSFDDLPLALKSCFMYFAAFREDNMIYAPSLLRIWIAEGFIMHEENKSLEDTAESFLEELAQRSMVQVESRSRRDNSIEWCRIHDLLHDVAIQKAKEDKFLTVYSEKNEEELDCGGSRRVVVHNSECNRWTKYQSPNLRVLWVRNSPLPDCSGHKLLKVLNVQDSRYEWESLEGLSQLKYFRLVDSEGAWNEEYFDKLLGNMKFLQTIDLDIFDSSFDLPDSSADCIWRIKTLRYVWIRGILGPPSSSDLKNLQTLYSMRTRESWKPTAVPNMPNLRRLFLQITEGLPLESLVAFLSTLKKLESLSIEALRDNEIPIEVADMREFPFYQHLTGLSFEGGLFWKMAFEATMFPTHLTELSFLRCGLQQDHLVVLEKLYGLKSLTLQSAYPNQTMRCSAGGFPSLQHLTLLWIEELEEWEIEEGAMPMLKELNICGCPGLQVPHGLQHLTALHELEWWLDKSDGAKEREIRDICKHVHSITID